MVGRANDLHLVADDYREQSSATSGNASERSKERGMGSQMQSSASLIESQMSGHSKLGSQRSESKAADLDQNYAAATPLKRLEQNGHKSVKTTPSSYDVHAMTPQKPPTGLGGSTQKQAKAVSLPQSQSKPQQRKLAPAKTIEIAAVYNSQPVSKCSTIKTMNTEEKTDKHKCEDQPLDPNEITKKPKNRVHGFDSIFRRWKYAIECVGLLCLDYELESSLQQLVVAA